MKPAEAPKPAIVGMLKGKMTASGNAANCGTRCPMIPFTCQRLAVALLPVLQPDQDGPEVRLIGIRQSPNPPIVPYNLATPSVFATICSTPVRWRVR